MNIKIKITIYLLLLFIFCLIGEIQAAEGGDDSNLQKSVYQKVTTTQEQTREALKDLLKSGNSLEYKCVAFKFLLLFYKYILLLLKFISIFELENFQEYVIKFLGLSELLELETKTFQACNLVSKEKLNEILGFVFNNGNLNLLKEFEEESEKGFYPTLKFLIRNLQQVTGVLNLMVYYLMNIYVDEWDPVAELLITFISDFYRTVLAFLENFAAKLAKLSLEEIKEMSKKVDVTSPLFTFKFSDPEKETKDMKLMEATREKKLQVIKRLTESGAKSGEEMLAKSKFGITNTESLQLECMCLWSLLSFSFTMTNCSFFDSEYKYLLKEIEEMIKKLLKLVLNRGTELDLNPEKALSIKLQAYSQLNMDGLRDVNAMFRTYSSYATEAELIHDFEQMLSILLSIFKQVEKKFRKWERDPYVMSLSSLLKDFFKSRLEALEEFVSSLKRKQIRINIKYPSDDDEEQDKASESEKKHKKHKKKRGSKQTSEAVSEGKKKESKKAAWLKHLESREDTMGTLRATSPLSSMETMITKSEDKPVGTKSKRREERLHRLLQEEEKSKKREEVKKTILEQKSSNTSARRRKQEERKTKNENRREREERERLEEREKERERQERVEHANYMYTLLNSVQSIEGMFEEAEKSRGGLGAMISYVLAIITEDGEIQSDTNTVDGLTDKMSTLSVSTKDDTGDTASQRRLGSSRRRANEVPDSAPRRPTSEFFASRVGVTARGRESSPSGRGGSRRSRQDRIDGQTQVDQGLLTFDGFTTSDPSSSQSRDEAVLKSKFLSFFSSNDQNISGENLSSQVFQKYCTFSDPSFSSITEDSSTEDISAALEFCGLEIQRLHSIVGPTLLGKELLELKLVEKDLISAFIRMLLILQRRNKES
ncbi:putative Secreted Protein (SKSR gene family) [Cryptosporidium meleagridis]